MTSVFQLYGRPLAENTPLPPLRIEGMLDEYESGVDYSSRLQIIDSIGKCTVELIDGNLPNGWRLFVDNFTKEVVLEWPAYTPPTNLRTDVPNGDFELGDDGSWRFGAGWSIQAGGAETGTYSGTFQNQRGISSIESQRVPYAGETISASCRFQQGASSEGNLVGRLLLIWCDAQGNMLPGGEGVSFTGGNLIRSGSNGAWHTSSASASSSAAKTVAVGFSANRKKQNKLARVDNFTWDHTWAAGTNSDEEYFITLRVRDSANRTATWSGLLTEHYLFFTSKPYPIIMPPENILIPGMGIYNGVLREQPTILELAQIDAVVVVSGELRSPFQAYTNWPYEAVDIGAVSVLSGELKSAFVLVSYSNWPAESLDIGAVRVQTGTLKTALITYSNWPAESLDIGAVTIITGTLA